MKVNNFTVSTSIEFYKNGEKRSYFVSMNVDPEYDHIRPEDLPLAQLEAATAVKKACIYNALVDGFLKTEDANEHMSNLKANTALLREELLKRKGT